MSKTWSPDFHCPESGVKLHLSDAKSLEKWNNALKGVVRTLPDGTTLAAPFESAYITDDNRKFYPLLDGVPILTPDGGFDFPDEA
jgi:uncharacterized protein YbaR (Trm112 family)